MNCRPYDQKPIVSGNYDMNSGQEPIEREIYSYSQRYIQNIYLYRAEAQRYNLEELPARHSPRKKRIKVVKRIRKVKEIEEDPQHFEFDYEEEYKYH